MSIFIRARFYADFVPDGVGSMNVPSAQELCVQVGPQPNNSPLGGFNSVLVLGGNSPSAAQILTACNSAAASAGGSATGGLGSAVNLGIIQGWGSGNP